MAVTQSTDRPRGLRAAASASASEWLWTTGCTDGPPQTAVALVCRSATPPLSSSSERGDGYHCKRSTASEDTSFVLVRGSADRILRGRSCDVHRHPQRCLEHGGYHRIFSSSEYRTKQQRSEPALLEMSPIHDDFTTDQSALDASVAPRHLSLNM